MKQALLPIFLCFAFYVPAQVTYLEPPELLADKATIDLVLDSLKTNKKLIAYVIYQTHHQPANVHSYLICNFGAFYGLWTITRDTILEYRTLNAERIFSYKDISLSGAITEEDKLKFKPPLLTVINNEIVIYCNEKRKVNFYFEYGENITTYNPLPRREKYRKKWIVIIKKSVLSQNQQ